MARSPAFTLLLSLTNYVKKKEVVQSIPATLSRSFAGLFILVYYWTGTANVPLYNYKGFIITGSSRPIFS